MFEASLEEYSDDESLNDVHESLHSYLEDEVLRNIGTSDFNDDRNPSENYWNKIHQNGSMWARNANGKISINVGDMFVDKE